MSKFEDGPSVEQQASLQRRGAAEEAVQGPQLTFEQGSVMPWIKELRRNVKNSKLHTTNQPTIFKAPSNISETDRAAYEPSVVSIGPLHGGCHEFQNIKWRFMRCLLSRCGNYATRILDVCFLGLKASDAEVRGCYSENLHHIDPCTLATTMLLDGCFILYLMLIMQEQGDTRSVVTFTKPNLTGSTLEKVSKVPMLDSESGPGSESDSVVDLEIVGEEHLNERWSGNRGTWTLVVYDLLKIGNQIPFFVIRLILDKLSFKRARDGPEDSDLLADLALNLFRDVHLKKSICYQRPRQNEIHHLLHLFHSSIVADRQVSLPGASPALERIPNATDLAMAGVKFKIKEEFDSFLDVTFKNGILEIPPLEIFGNSKSTLRNLIAFEQCYPHTNTEVTTYAYFMDCIVDTGNDARLLYTKGILFNVLSTHDEVASLFNQLCNQITYDPSNNYLNDLFIEVNKYHGSKWHQWRAGLLRDYFSSPWAIISVVAAVLLLLLTIEQCFFAAFSYFRPP